jgi:hypothetical protein
MHVYGSGSRVNASDQDTSLHVSMLLDNHYEPDHRVAFEIELLREAGISAKVVAWDRRTPPSQDKQEPPGDELVRLPVPAPSGGGWRTLVALTRFARKVWRDRTKLFEGVSLLVVHDVYLLPLGWVLARKLNLPFIYDAHEDFQRAEVGTYPRFLRRMAATAEGRLAQSAVAVVVPGSSRTERWRGVIRGVPIVVPNFVQREQATTSGDSADWDLLYIGTVSDARRPDLLIDLARIRPDLRIAIAGDGRSATAVMEAAPDLPNLTYLGWRSDADSLFERTRSIYYGLDPSHPYSEVACPNTLYHALRHRKPLIFFCGGEPAEVASEFRIGIRCSPSTADLARAVDAALAGSDWQFDAAWKTTWKSADLEEFVEAIASAARKTQ